MVKNGDYETLFLLYMPSYLGHLILFLKNKDQVEDRQQKDLTKQLNRFTFSSDSRGQNNRFSKRDQLMAGDIEKFLIKKLDKAIEDTKSSEHYLLAKLFRLDKDFQSFKNLLNNPRTRDSLAALGETKPREILYLLDNVLSEWKLISKKPAVQGIVDARGLSRKLMKIKKDFNVGEGSGSSAVERAQDAEESLPENLDTYRWSSRTVGPSRVRGLADKVRFMERLLLRKESKDGFKAIAIFGILGVGKTTLCQIMFNNPEVMKAKFLPRIWVCLSKQPKEDEDNRKEIVKRMLKCLGVEDEIIEYAGREPNLGLQKLIFALRLQLRGKKYLIVLDDAENPDKCFENLASLSAQEENCYEQLAYGLPKGHGGTVIVTSRSEEIAKKMVGEENSHHLLPLKDTETCWQIFKDAVEADGKRFPAKLQILKDKIIDRCAGLPLAARMMGEIMHRNL